MDQSLKNFDALASAAILVGIGGILLGIVLIFVLGIQFLILTASFALPLLSGGIVLKLVVVALQLYARHVAAYTRIAAALEENLEDLSQSARRLAGQRVETSRPDDLND